MTADTASLPGSSGLVLLRHPLMRVPVREEIESDPLPRQLQKALGWIYKSKSQSQGARRFHTALCRGTGFAFEIALANLLAKFGLLVLFGGSSQDELEPETEGFDLLVLGQKNSRAVLISVKGGDRNATSIADDVTKVKGVLPKVREYLPHIASTHGIVVYNRFSDVEVGVHSSGVVRAVGRDWIQRLHDADDARVVEWMLWPPGVGVRS